jgi:hypothetical protein
MRFFSSLGFGIAAMLAGATAFAASGKGETGGKGGLGPDTSTQAGAEGTASTSSSVDSTEFQYRNRSTRNPDEVPKGGPEAKPWDVSAIYELHRLIRQEDLAGAVKLFQLISVSGRYALTDSDTVSIFGGATQGFIADQGESGVRANDISLQYSHSFSLPDKFRLRAAVGTTIPISYYSQLASNITTPSLTLGLSRRFGDFSVSASFRGAYFWDKYRESAPLDSTSTGGAGGAQNTQFVAGGVLSGEYDLPFHRPLSFGFALSDSYYWYYDPGMCPVNSGQVPGNANACLGGMSGPSQPVQQSYGGEIFVRYVMPELAGIKSDFTIALGNSTPNFVLHDGIVHPYFLYRETAEVYLALGARY